MTTHQKQPQSSLEDELEQRLREVEELRVRIAEENRQKTKHAHTKTSQHSTADRHDATPRRNTFHSNNTALRKSTSSAHYSQHASAAKRPRTCTQVPGSSSTDMTRSRSAQSASGANPFTGGSVQGPRPPFKTPSQSQPNAARPIERWQHRQADDPFSGIGSTATRSQPAPIIPDVGETPDVFLSKYSMDFDDVDASPPQPQFLPPPPAGFVPPLTDATTCPTMSPQYSAVSYVADNVSLNDPSNMLRIQSGASNMSDDFSCFRSTLGKRSRFDDGSLAQVGAAPSLQEMPAPDLNDQLGHATSHPMSRSITNASSRSTSSRLSDRAKEALAMQNQRALSTALQPKPAESRDSHNTSSRSGAAGGKKKEMTGKPVYHRPPQKRVYCAKCDEYPDGFRGEHELRRHTDSKHSNKVTKWVCKPGDPNGDIQPVVPIDKCKACQTQKQYGAYYNAAAHLRRAHFNKKPTRKGSKGTENKEPSQASGQEWPSMDDLKRFGWFYKICVDMDGRPIQTASPEEPLLSSFDAQQPSPSVTSGGGGLDLSSLGGVFSPTSEEDFGSGTLAAAAPFPDLDGCGVSPESMLDNSSPTTATTISPTLNEFSSFPVVNPSAIDMSLFDMPSAMPRSAAAAMSNGGGMELSSSSLFGGNQYDDWALPGSDNGDAGNYAAFVAQ